MAEFGKESGERRKGRNSARILSDLMLENRGQLITKVSHLAVNSIRGFLVYTSFIWPIRVVIRSVVFPPQ